MDDKSTLNFKHARFGMFIHWGLYAIPSGRWKGKRMDYIGEWIQSRFRIPNAEYSKLTEEFNPLHFDADEWVKCAKDTGMAYIVFTAKHHDGFAMYHSKVSRYNIVDATPFGRDVLRELAYACKRHDMKLGIYYSHCLDWHDPDGADPGPKNAANFRMPWGNNWDFQDFDTKDFSRYFYNKAIPQIKELLSEYGPVFLLWFDCPLQITREQCIELRSMVKSLQPDCLINGRIGYDLGDFGSLADNKIPEGNTGFPLESANTLNHTWGFKKDDHNWDDAKTLVGNMLDTIEKDVNFLLNIGPRADGRFPDASLDILNEAALWRKHNNAMIQYTEPNPFPQKFPWGWCLQFGNTLQFFVRDIRTEITISGLSGKIKDCNFPYKQSNDKLQINLPERNDELPIIATVEFEEPPKISQALTLQDDTLILSPVTGKLIHGLATENNSSEIKFGAAAEIIMEKSECSLSQSGALTQWHHPGDGICWMICISEPGTYEIQLTTTNRCHSVAWTGKRVVRLEFAGQSIEKELKADRKLDSEYYPGAVSNLGVIELSAPEQGMLALTSQKITGKEAVHINLTSVEIIKTNIKELC